MAQSNIKIEGQVVNAETNEPIAYANVGIPAKYSGTATDGSGHFIFELPDQSKNDTLRISAIGFESSQFLVGEFMELSDSRISLQPKTYVSEGITVRADKASKTEWLGTKELNFFQRFFKSGGAYGEAGFGRNLGAAYAFKVNWEKVLPMRVLVSRIKLGVNRNDWPVRLRCRVTSVDPDTGWPGKNLAKANVFTKARDPGWMRCDFSNLDVTVKAKSFFVIFEWLPQIQDQSKKEIAPLFDYQESLDSEVFMRREAMGRWEKISYSLSYGVKVEY